MKNLKIFSLLLFVAGLFTACVNDQVTPEASDEFKANAEAHMKGEAGIIQETAPPFEFDILSAEDAGNFYAQYDRYIGGSGASGGGGAGVDTRSTGNCETICPNSLSIILRGDEAGDCACLLGSSGVYYDDDDGNDEFVAFSKWGANYIAWIPDPNPNPIIGVCDGTEIRVKLCKLDNDIIDLCTYDCMSYTGYASSSGTLTQTFYICAEPDENGCIEFVLGKYESNVTTSCGLAIDPNFSDDYTECTEECDHDADCIDG